MLDLWRSTRLPHPRGQQQREGRPRARRRAAPSFAALDPPAKEEGGYKLRESLKVYNKREELRERVYTLREELKEISRGWTRPPVPAGEGGGAFSVSLHTQTLPVHTESEKPWSIAQKYKNTKPLTKPQKLAFNYIGYAMNGCRRVDQLSPRSPRAFPSPTPHTNYPH